MSDDSPLPPVRLRSEAQLARDALGTPLIARAARLARWARPGTRVAAGGALDAARLPSAAAALGLGDDRAGRASAGLAWRVAVRAGLVTTGPDVAGAGHTVTADGQPSRLTGGSPAQVLDLWLDALDTVIEEALRADEEALRADGATLRADGETRAEDGDPRGADGSAGSGDPGGAAFLDGVLGNLYLLTAGHGEADDAPVPLPALAASMIVPADMTEPTDDVLEQVSEATFRLDHRFRSLQTAGLVAFQPVDEALLADGDTAAGRTTGTDTGTSAGTGTDTDADVGTDADADAGTSADAAVDDRDVTRYGMVRLTPLGRYGLRRRLLRAGFDAPAIGDLAGKDAEALLHGTADYPQAAAEQETEQWLARRAPLDAARELLAAARGTDDGAPLRRLRCQQALSLVGGAAEPALREVLDDAELGGLARVWLTEQGAADVPPPTGRMVYWLTVDTLAAQLAAEGNSTELQALVEGLARQHSEFFDTAWRVDHPATAEVLEAMGRLHPDKQIAKQARKAAYKARSQHGR